MPTVSHKSSNTLMSPLISTALIISLIIVTAVVSYAIFGAQTFRTLEAVVATYNIEYGNEAHGAPAVIRVFKENDIDVAILQESKMENGTNGVAVIAAGLNYNYAFFNRSDISIVSKWPIEKIPHCDNFKHFAVVKIIPDESLYQRPFYVVGVHLDDCPYQPFQAYGLPYECNGTLQPNTTSSDELVKYANEARGADISEIISILNNPTIIDPNIPIILGGDFNEPSHRDWDEKSVKAGFCNVAVPYPATLRLENMAHLIDMYREKYPDPVAQRGNTWGLSDPGYLYRPDRIDFLFRRGNIKTRHVYVAKNGGSDHHPVIAHVSI